MHSSQTRYSTEEVKLLLQILDEILPQTNWEWEEVAHAYNLVCEHPRSSSTLRMKFQRLQYGGCQEQQLKAKEIFTKIKNRGSGLSLFLQTALMASKKTTQDADAREGKKKESTHESSTEDEEEHAEITKLRSRFLDKLIAFPIGNRSKPLRKSELNPLVFLFPTLSKEIDHFSYTQPFVVQPRLTPCNGICFIDLDQMLASHFASTEKCLTPPRYQEISPLTSKESPISWSIESSSSK